MPNVQDPLKRIDRALTRAERHIARIFRTTIAGLKAEINLGEMARLLEAGQYEVALDRLMSAGERLGAASTAVFVMAGQSTAAFLESAGVARLSFDQVNHRAVAMMQRRSLRLIREFTNDQRAATRNALTRGITAGINPRAQARLFRDVVGLTDRQATAMSAYRARLERIGRPGVSEKQQASSLSYKLRDGRGDAQIRRAIKDSRPLPAAKIDWLVGRYAERSVKHRAEVIARTESLGAVHQGTEEMYEQAFERGSIDPATVERTWNTSIDGRERETHRKLNGQVRPVGQPWTTVNGTLRFPGDPDAPAEEVIQCRCIVTTQIKAR